MDRKIKENDVFNFSYNCEYVENHFEPYHCFDGQLIALKNHKDELVLVDTYWGFGVFDQHNTVFTIQEAEQKGSLTFICNLEDIEECSERDLKYYDNENIFNLSYQHRCYKNYYKRKGAEKSAKKMRKVIKDRIDKNKRKIKYAKHDIELLKEKLQKVEEGNIEDVYI